jgi:hypothetical protein
MNTNTKPPQYTLEKFLAWCELAKRRSYTEQLESVLKNMPKGFEWWLEGPSGYEFDKSDIEKVVSVTSYQSLKAAVGYTIAAVRRLIKEGGGNATVFLDGDGLYDGRDFPFIEYEEYDPGPITVIRIRYYLGNVNEEKPLNE